VNPLPDLIVLLGGGLLAIGLFARGMIARATADSSVDQHYWVLAAKAYREQNTLPVVLRDKYLLEDETQAYPPLFGYLLGQISNQTMWPWVIPALETATLLVLVALLQALGVRWDMLLLALAFYVAAPILAVYNAQLTSRALGNLFLFAAMALQVVAVELATATWIVWVFWIASAFLIGLVVATHKMTLQLHLVLLPFWGLALQAWQVPAATLAGVLLYVCVVGWSFAGYQFRAHWEIVRFWNRHWPDLGGHQFHLSPIYGNPAGDRSSCFHVPGRRGALKHWRVLVSYGPFIVFLPICSFVADAWPPAWVLVWVFGIYGWALATLFIPRLKCFGGGHLYLFNAIAPGAIYVAHLPAKPAVIALLLVGVILTAVSLASAWRVVTSRQIARGQDFEAALEHLRTIPKSRVAVFPLQTAEPVAAYTDHAVLWGGHGMGFDRLEGFFPILSRPLSDFFRQYKIEWILWDSKFWPTASQRLTSEKLLASEDLIRSFGRWRLAPVETTSSQGE
jgi:hypothetical protein